METESHLEEFRALLDGGHNEQVYQKALERNPRLIPQEFVQNHGVHMSMMLRKLRLADNYTSDFLYLSKSSADWNIVFIELEKPSTPYFRSGSDELHPEFLAGINQIDRWRAWARKSSNLEHMMRETLGPIWAPAAMRSNPVYPKYVLVSGRRADFAGDDRKRDLIHAKERDDFKILSFDSLIDGYRYHQAVYLGVRLNSHIRIESDDFVEEGTFAWIEPERLEISQALHDNILEGKSRWRWMKSLSPKVFALDDRLPRIRITKQAEPDDAANDSRH
jgi:hypothetical protein